jgi:hypothetical protein
MRNEKAKAQAQRTLGRESHVDWCAIESGVRRLLHDLHRYPLPVAGGEAGKNLADDECKELFHDAEAIRIMWFVSLAEIEPCVSRRGE